MQNENMQRPWYALGGLFDDKNIVKHLEGHTSLTETLQLHSTRSSWRSSPQLQLSFLR